MALYGTEHLVLVVEAPQGSVSPSGRREARGLWRSGGLWNILWFIQALCAAMRGCVWLFALALVVGHGLCTDPAQTRRDSFDIRRPDIDPSWYTSRGVRPVGRFGRRVKVRRPRPRLARGPPLPPCALRRGPSAACTDHWLVQ